MKEHSAASAAHEWAIVFFSTETKSLIARFLVALQKAGCAEASI